MRPIIDKKWRKKFPNKHKTYGEKRERDEQIIRKINESEAREWWKNNI